MFKVNGEDDELKEQLDYAHMASRVPQVPTGRCSMQESPGQPAAGELWVQTWDGLAVAQEGGTGQAEADRRLWHSVGPLDPGWKKGGEPLPVPLLSLYNSLLLGRRGGCD